MALAGLALLLDGKAISGLTKHVIVRVQFEERQFDERVTAAQTYTVQCQCRKCQCRLRIRF